MYISTFPHGLMFHRFHQDGAKSNWQGALSESDFESILLHVGVKNILSPDKWINLLQRHKLKNNHFCITFDDGLRCQYEIPMPVLNRYNLKAFWFIYTSVFSDQPIKSELYSFAASMMGGMNYLIEIFMNKCPVELKSHLNSQTFHEYKLYMEKAFPFYSNNDIKFRYLRNNSAYKELFESVMDSLLLDYGIDVQEVAATMWINKNQLLKLAHNGHFIGLHSHTHPYAIAEKSLSQQREEYVKNYDFIYNMTGIKPITMSHPLCSYNNHTLSVLRSLGIRCGFRSNMHAPKGGSINQSNLELAREDATNLKKLCAKQNNLC